MSGVMLLAAMGGAPGFINQSLPEASNPSSCSWALGADGTYSVGDGAGGALAGNWLTPTNFVSFYQGRIDITSGSVDAGTTGSWVDMSTGVGISRLSAGAVAFTVQIREKGSGTVRTSQNLSMTVT